MKPCNRFRSILAIVFSLSALSGAWGQSKSDTTATAPADATPKPVPDEVIVDNTDETFRKIGQWNVSTKVPGFWGQDYLWAAKGDGNAKSIWTLTAPDDGRWQVDARWTWGAQGAKDRATNAPFIVKSPADARNVRVDMSDPLQAARWNALAVLDLKKQDKVEVTLTNEADNSVAADAVRLVRLPTACARSELLYENTFTMPTEQQKIQNQKDWVMEGGGVADWADGNLRLKPKNYTPKRSKVETDHFVYWLKKDFPADLAIEWDFRFPPPDASPSGLAIIFFSARGAGGQDLFDPSLAKRDGIFERYHSGDINCYHLSYLAIGRGSANIRKNPGFHLVASAPDLVTKGGPDKWHHLRLTRFGSDIELTVDGARCLTWTDDGKTFGHLLDGGKIGLRQQNDLFWGDYTNLRVYALKRQL